MMTRHGTRPLEKHGATRAAEGVLVAPRAVMAIIHATGIGFQQVLETIPTPTPMSGLVICAPGGAVYDLPPGWTGIWARAEAPPPGAWVPLPATVVTDPQALRHAITAADAWRRERCLFSQQAVGTATTLKTVNEIGIALSAERNPEQLLALILSRARQLVAADAGSIYLLERDHAGRQLLRFAWAQNDSVQAPWKASVLPLNPESVAASVVLRKEVVVIDDAYALPPHGPLRHDQRFDQRFGYRTRSIVGIPLATRDGDVIGVLQLINRKPCAALPLLEPTQATEALPFSPDDVELLRSLASQAAVSLENTRLYKDIEGLFEGFVGATITAIEQRDPATAGHSFRVADGTIALARRVEQLAHGPWVGVCFSPAQLRELRYAALLHDVGKVGIREPLLTKACKLYDDELASLRSRFALARALHRARCVRAWLDEAIHNPQAVQQRLPQYEAKLQQELREFDSMFQAVLTANNPNVLETGEFSALEAIAQRHVVDWDGDTYPLLTAREVQVLSLRRGTLTSAERVEIEKHVTHSFHFLRTIPWTRDLARVPDLAFGHHEKLDGTGYPLGLAGDAIPLGTRMITIADIFDALTARDRPYKRAIPLEHALRILEEEARGGKLDPVLVQVWIEQKAWEDITDNGK